MPDTNNMGPNETSSIGEEVFSPPVAETAAPAESAAPGMEETAPVQTAPAAEETAPVETAPAPQESAALAIWLKEPGAGGISCGGWAGIGLAAGLLLSTAAVLIGRAARRRKHKPTLPEPPGSGTVWVEKLHDQGARTSQQDCFYVSDDRELVPDVTILKGPPGLLAVVADGMGGLADGDKVSQAAVSAMAHGFYQAQGAPQQVLLQLAEQANSAVNRLLGEDGVYRSGSTLVAGLLREGAFHYLSIGDSRICLYRRGVLYQLNREHVYRNELYVNCVNGEETLAGAAGHPKAAGLTSFLGMGRLKYIDLPAEPVAVLPGDRFILMSDGVYNALTQQELAAALSTGPGQTAQALDKTIRAKGYQNQDNYTAVILNC